MIVVNLNIENEVTALEQNSGFGPLSGQSGWLYDRRIISSANLPPSVFSTVIDPILYNVEDGLRIEDFISGVLTGIDHETWIGRDFTLTPVYSTGMYTSYFNRHNLYSDYSTQLICNGESETDGFIYEEISEDAIESSFSVRTFIRDELANVFIHREWNQVEEFTGQWDGSERESIGAPPDWDSALVSDRHYEYLFYDDKIYFNQSPLYTIGSNDTSVDSVLETWEYHGAGNLNGRLLYLKHFPVVTARVYTYDGSSLTSWSGPGNNSLDFVVPGQKRFHLNEDLGIIEMSGRQADPLVLAQTINSSVTTISIVYEPSFDEYGDNGIITIGSEKIRYLGKTANAFINCTRGYLSTTAATHSAFSVVQDIQHGDGTEDLIYVSYTVAPRIDYESTLHDKRTANQSPILNVERISHGETTAITQIAVGTDNISRLVLSTTAPTLGGNLYGPIYYGIDSARFTTTAYNALGNTVSGAEITMEVTYGPGRFNNASNTFEGLSNIRGEISALFNAPYSETDILKEVTLVAHDSGDTVLTVPDLDTNVRLNDVYLFQVLKHDPISGTIGKHARPTARATVSSLPGISQYVDLEVAYTEDYDNGQIIILGSDSVKRTFTIKGSLPIGENALRLYLAESTNPLISDHAWLLEEGALEFSESTGVRVLVYHYSTDYEHPITGEPGAYGPVRPSSLSLGEAVFGGQLLPIPDAEDDLVNLARYVIVCPAIATIQAFAIDPYTGTEIESNILRVDLQIPLTLQGVNSEGVLPVPHGWKFITESYNVGGGIGGANFITINPTANLTNIFTLRGSI